MLSKILRGAAAPVVERFDWYTGTIAARPTAPAGCPDAGGATEKSPGDRRMAELQEQLEQRVGEAHQAGFREGEAEGRRQASAAVHPVLEKLAHTIEEIAGLRPRLLRESEADLVELSVGIARRILHRELSVDPGALQGLVGGALAKLASQEISRVRVHPELEIALTSCLQHAGQGGLQVTADPTLARGGIVLETSRGKLDASVETQLSEIERGLADLLPEE